MTGEWKPRLKFYGLPSNKMQCAENAALLRGLLKSIGISAAQEYVYVGRSSGPETRLFWDVTSVSPLLWRANLQLSKAAHEGAPLDPHFTFHSVVYAEGKYHDASYGDTGNTTAVTLLEPDAVPGSPINAVNGETLRVKDTSIVFRDASRRTSLIDPATGLTWLCPH